MNHRTRIVGWGVLALLVALFAALWAGSNSRDMDELREGIDRATTTAEVNKRAAERNANYVRELRQQVKRLGGKPVVGPDEVSEPTDPPEPDPSLSQGDIRSAVAAYCAAGLCDGEDGAPGRSVTPSQVAAAVASYCTANGECRGAQGNPGNDGSPGADGEPGAAGANGNDGATGPQGPPPSNQQVADAVASFCSDGRCRGPQGPQGPAGTPGVDGKDGRGVSSVSCSSLTPVEFTFTYTDGTTETVSCGGASQP